MGESGEPLRTPGCGDNPSHPGRHIYHGWMEAGWRA